MCCWHGFFLFNPASAAGQGIFGLYAADAPETCAVPASLPPRRLSCLLCCLELGSGQPAPVGLCHGGYLPCSAVVIQHGIISSCLQRMQKKISKAFSNLSVFSCWSLHRATEVHGFSHDVKNRVLSPLVRGEPQRVLSGRMQLAVLEFP